MASDPAGAHRHIILVTGLSGAGRTSSLKVLEDMGCEAVDNLPLSLLPQLLGPAFEETTAGRRTIAIGLDIRTRDFAAADFIAEIDKLAPRQDLTTTVLFLDCDDEVLVRRFTETRRRHPLAVDRSVTDGIRLERELIAPIRDRADLVIDTSHLHTRDLRRLIQANFDDAEQGLAIFVTSFAYRRGLPRDADLVFDVRFLDNPHYNPDLQPLTGQDPRVQDFIASDPDFERFFQTLTQMLNCLLPRYSREGKSYLTIAFGCTGGRHRSVMVVEKLVAWMKDLGYRANVLHRDIGAAAHG